jgi:hypothetical protein
MFLALMAFPLAMTTAAAADGSASGWLEVKGQRVKLQYVFAAVMEDEAQGEGKEKIEVLLSDKPVPLELRKPSEAWSFWAGDQARKGELHGVILYIDPATKAWSRGQRLSRYGMEFYSQPEGDLIFAPAQAAPGELAGKVSMKQPVRTVDEDEGPWRVEAEFRTPVAARPGVTATYTGAEALASGPYKAVQAYLQACQSKDLEVIRKTLNANAQQLLTKYAAEQGRKAVLDMFAAEAAETAKLKLTKVIVRGDSAEIVYSGGSGDSSLQQTMRAVFENGAWKFGH